MERPNLEQMLEEQTQRYEAAQERYIAAERLLCELLEGSWLVYVLTGRWRILSFLKQLLNRYGKKD